MHDCIVIGGGVIGMLTARELALSGLQVTLIERGSLGQECSWAGGGILSPLYPWHESKKLFELVRWSQANYPTLVEELYEATGIEPEWQQCGMLILESARQGNAMDWARENDVAIEQIGSDQLQHLEPKLKDSVSNALWLPEIAQIRNPLFIQAIRQDLQQLGVRLREGTHVTRITTAKGKLQSVETSNDKFICKNVVLACGAWTQQLIDQLGGHLPVKPVRGQMLCYQGPCAYIQHILLQDGNYAIPRQDGHILVGSTVEDVGFDKGITQQARQNLDKAVSNFLPDIKHFTFVRQWSGLRPATPSGLPYICPYPDIAGLFLNTGHYRNGVLLAPGSARLLVDIMLGRQPIVSHDDFQLHAQDCQVTY